MECKKQILDVRDEKIFYNPIFQTANDKMLYMNPYSIKNNILTYGQLLDEVHKRDNNLPFIPQITRIYDSIATKDLEHRTHHTLVTNDGDVRFQNVTQKMLYEEIILQKYLPHAYTHKWVERLCIPIEWNKVWKSVFSPLTFEETRTQIWELIHLNSYTQYSYNKWHNSQGLCPLCSKIPSTKFHVTHECDFVRAMWSKVQPFLQQIHPPRVTEEEMAYGLLGSQPPIRLRNFITYVMREVISVTERKAYYNKQYMANLPRTISRFHTTLTTYTTQHYNNYYALSRMDLFEKHFLFTNVLVEIDDSDLVVKNPIPD